MSNEIILTYNPKYKVNIHVFILTEMVEYMNKWGRRDKPSETFKIFDVEIPLSRR